MNKGKVYLIGAGCGQYDLITVRGIELLCKCDTVVYDSLTDEKLLCYAPEHAEKIGVGKRAGRPSETQDNINRLIAQKAEEGKTVARLKGGDPFVFGRGGEEALYLAERNIQYEIVPGISSAIAVPEMAGIPVTHRSVSRSFHVITGHTKEDRLPAEMNTYAGLNGTLVFLMGLGHLKEISDSLIENGKSPKTPAAVISDGGRTDQKTVRGTLADIAEISAENGMHSPAVIVVGETAAFDMTSSENRMLEGVSVTVTGTKRFSERLAAKLENDGASVTRANIMKIVPFTESDEIRKAVSELSEYTVVVLTSPNGAGLFIQLLRKYRIDFRKLSHLRFAVIGNATAAVLEQNGIYPDIVPDRYTSGHLGAEICSKANAGENVLILRAVQGTSELTDILSQNGIRYSDVKLYDIKGSEDSVPEETDTDFIVFASCSGVDDFYRHGYSISKHTKAVCIGEATAAELKKHRTDEIYTPEIQNADSIVQLIRKMKG